MKIIIKATGFDLTPAIVSQVEKKFNPVAKFLPANTKPLELRVEVGLTTKHHAKGDIFRAEANLRVHEDVLRSEATREDLISAITEAREELEMIVKKYKGKKADSLREIKKVLRK